MLTYTHHIRKSKILESRVGLILGIIAAVLAVVNMHDQITDRMAEPEPIVLSSVHK